MHVSTRPIPRLGIILAVLVTALFAARAAPAYAAVPTVTGLNPTSGTVLGGTSVVITGTGFTGVTGADGVKFGATNAASYTVNSDTQITAVSPASPGNAAGAVDVIVKHPDGSSANTALDNFNYVTPGAPTITSVSPTGGPITGGTTVTITGTNFVGMNPTGDVTFGGDAAIYVVQNETTIVATSPAHAAGTVRVQVTTPFGTTPNTTADDFTYGLTPPTVTGLSPDAGPIAGGNLVVITGTGFTGVTEAGGVTFGGTNATSYTVNSGTQITAIAPQHAAGSVNVVVTHPTNGSSVNTVNDDYLYGSLPVVTALSPTAGSVAGGFTVIITGTGLTGATAVTFGGTAATSYTVNLDTQITATAPAHAAGTVDVLVTTPLGTSANTSADNFTYTAGPTVTSISPTSGAIAGGTTVTITGTGFTGATSVTFGGTSATFTVNNSTQITATSPAHAAGTVDVLVTTPLGTSPNTAADNFVYGTGPQITAISPTQGPVAGGTTVTITGTGFTGATAVAFGATAATSFTVVSDTQITAVSPAGVNGVVRISVTTPVGTSPDTAADNFTYGTGAVTSFTLYFRWSLIVWSGKDGADVAATLKGLESPDNPATNDVSAIVTAIFFYNNPLQKFEGYFPGSAGIPGANDFTTFVKGRAYWIAISTTGSTTWTVATD